MHEPNTEAQLHLMLFSDQALFRIGLAHLLAAQPDLRVVCECGVPETCLECLRHSAVDVVLLDLAVGTDVVKAFISAARAAGYQGRFLLIADSADAEPVAQALQLGTSGIFRKVDAPERLMVAIRLVAAGAVWIDHAILQLLSVPSFDSGGPTGPQRSMAHLKDAETNVILGIMEGLTTRKIGESMGLSEGKVKNILQGLFARTGVRKRSQLVRLALEGCLGDHLAKSHHQEAAAGRQSLD